MSKKSPEKLEQPGKRPVLTLSLVAAAVMAGLYAAHYAMRDALKCALDESQSGLPEEKWQNPFPSGSTPESESPLKIGKDVDKPSPAILKTSPLEPLEAHISTYSESLKEQARRLRQICDDLVSGNYSAPTPYDLSILDKFHIELERLKDMFFKEVTDGSNIDEFLDSRPKETKYDDLYAIYDAGNHLSMLACGDAKGLEDGTMSFMKQLLSSDLTTYEIAKLINQITWQFELYRVKWSSEEFKDLQRRFEGIGLYIHHVGNGIVANDRPLENNLAFLDQTNAYRHTLAKAFLRSDLSEDQIYFLGEKIELTTFHVGFNTSTGSQDEDNSHLDLAALYGLSEEEVYALQEKLRDTVGRKKAVDEYAKLKYLSQKHLSLLPQKEGMDEAALEDFEFLESEAASAYLNFMEAVQKYGLSPDELGFEGLSWQSLLELSSTLNVTKYYED